MNPHIDPMETGVLGRERKLNAVEGLYATTHALLSRRQFGEAAAVCRAMLACAPHDERGWLALGACHEGLTQYDLALQLYAVGRAMSGGGARCELARARLFRALGKAEEADDAMARACSLAEAADDDELLALLHRETRLS
jgi:tetratricopeptide (TPR) repeat protein